MTLYLSGSISNDPNYKKKFEEAEKTLVSHGYEVINPVKICSHLPDESAWSEYMKVCIRELPTADGIALIDTTIKSIGRDLEVYLGGHLSIPTNTVETWARIKTDREIWEEE